MIKSLSPYYITIPFTSPIGGLICTSYTLQIFVWNGAKNSPPTNPSYEITKDNPASSNESDEINIARLINDFILFMPQQGTGVELIDGNNQYWVKTQVLYTTSNPADYVPQLRETQLLLRGYGYGMDGKNSQPPTNKILLSGTEFKVNRGGVFSLPILINETETTETITLISVTNTGASNFEYVFSLDFTPSIIYSQVRNTIGGAWGIPLAFSGITSPKTRVVSILTPFETRIYAFNPATGNTIYSNIILRT